MDKTKMTMAAAMSAAVGLPAGAATALERPVPPAATYADLLEPVPNAVERLKASDAEAAARPQVVQTQYYYHHHHHHHHHHQQYRRGYWWGGRYYYNGWGPRYRHYHHHHDHHHHHHHHGYYQP